MTTKVRRLAATATAAAVLAVSLTGCGVIGQVRNVVGAANTLADFSDRLGRSAQLTFTAKYRVHDGSTVTLVQQPPNSAYLGPDGRYVFTPEYLLLCEDGSCSRATHNLGAAVAANTGALSTIAGPGFVTPELALGLVAAAAFVPGADITKSSRKIAGQDSLCADVRGLDKAASPGETGVVKDFSVCVTEQGVLASFSGHLDNGEAASIELVGFSGDADPAAFQAPSGVEVVDVDQLPVS